MFNVKYYDKTTDPYGQSLLDAADQRFRAVDPTNNNGRYCDSEVMFQALLSAWDYIDSVTRQEIIK